MIATLSRALNQRLKRWTKRRHGTQTSPQILHNKRIYIVPSKSGAIFALMLFVMLVGSMNYNNSMGLALSFLLGSFVLVVMHHCHRNLLKLEVSYGEAEPVFAGQNASIPVSLHNANAHPRNDLRLSLQSHQFPAINLAKQETVSAGLDLPMPTRGRHQPPRLNVSGRFPGGLFHAWTWIYWDTSILVFPAPHGDQPLPQASIGQSDGRAHRIRGDEEFSELRKHEPGQNMSRVAWKQLARSGTLFSKNFDDAAHEELWLTLEKTQTNELEQQLSQLSQWVLTAEDQKIDYGLRLPNTEFTPSNGRAHRDRCLTALAEFGLESP